MIRSILLWILAFLITIASAVYQRMTGPTHPFRGKMNIAGQQISYKLDRTHDAGDQPVIINVPDKTIAGQLIYKHYKTDEPWTYMTMIAQDGKLIGYLPHQPPAGKLLYYVELTKDNSTFRMPPDSDVRTRFKGVVPPVVLIPHIFFMFTAMVVSSRAGLAFLAKSTYLKSYTIWTIFFLIMGGLILGPLVQKYAFGAFWTGFPNGTDLTDNKTMIAFVAWIIALYAIYKKPTAKVLVLVAAIVTLIIFLIPHSLLGS